jgi:hypothetical protein
MSENLGSLGSLYGEVAIKDNTEEQLGKGIKILDAYGRAWSSSAEKVVPAAKQTEVAVSQLSAGMTSFGKSVMSVALGMIGAGSIVQAMTTVANMTKRGYEEARELSRAQVQLSAALGYNSVALREQREELDKNLAIEEQDTAIAQLRLANYIKDEQQIRRLIPAVADLSRAKGIDLASAADIVARAISSDSGELGRFKIVLDGARGSTERIDSAIKGLTANFGGQAQVVKENMNLFERLGKGIGDYFKDLFKTQTEEEKRIFEARKVIAGFESGMLAWKGYDKEYAEAKAYLKKISDEQTAASEAAKKRGEEESRRADELEKKEIARKKREADRIQYAEELRKTAGDVERQQDEEQAQRSSKNHQQQSANVKEFYEAKLKQAEEEGKKEADLEKRGVEAIHQIELSEIQFRAEYFEKLATDTSLSVKQRAEYERQASEERIKLIESEAKFKKDRLDEQFAALALDNENMRDQIEKVRDLLKNEIDVKVKLDVQSAQLTSKDLEQQKTNRISVVQEWSNNISNSLISGIHLITAKTTDEFLQAGQEIFGTIQSIGVSTKNEFAQDFGIIGDAVLTLGKTIYNITQVEKKLNDELAAKREEYHNTVLKINMALRGARETVDDWLASMGLGDVSNWSKAQLVSRQKQIATQQMAQISSVTGLDVTGLGAAELTEAFKSIDKGKLNIAVYTEGLEAEKARKEIISQYPQLEYLMAQMIKSKNFAQMEAIRETLLTGELSAQGAKISQTIEGYEIGAGIDHTKSMTKEDFEADLEAEERLGKITGLEHAKYLYEASAGIEDLPAGLKKNRFSDYYSEADRANILSNYLKSQQPTTTYLESQQPTTTSTGKAQTRNFITAADGGIFNTPTIISEYGQPEAAVPLNNPTRAYQILDQIANILPGGGGGGNFSVSVSIDPNIPITQEFGRAIGNSIAERMVLNLNSRGYR